MKLLIVTQVLDKNHPILGFFHGWLLEFSKYFDELHVICLKKGEYDLPKYVHVYSLGKEDGENNLKYLYRFYKYFCHIFFRVRVNYVFFHMGAVFTIVAAPFFVLRKLYKTKFYWWKTHGHIGWRERLSLLFVDRIYSASESSFPLETRKKHVIGHAIDTELYFQHSIHNSNQLVAVVVGRVTPIKELEIAINAVYRYINTGNNMVLRILGPIDDDVYLEKLNNLISKLKIQENILFIGSVAQNVTVREYHSADILLHPSYKAGFDKVVLEAMLCGVVPYTSIGSYKPMLDKFNLFIEPLDVKKYAEGIQKFTKLKEKEKDELISKLRKIVIQKHSLDTLSGRIFNIH